MGKRLFTFHFVVGFFRLNQCIESRLFRLAFQIADEFFLVFFERQAFSIDILRLVAGNFYHLESDEPLALIS